MEDRAHVSECENTESRRGCEVYIKEELDPEMEINAAEYVNVSIKCEVEENFEPDSPSASPSYKQEDEKYKNNEITESGESKIGKKRGSKRLSTDHDFNFKVSRIDQVKFESVDVSVPKQAERPCRSCNVCVAQCHHFSRQEDKAKDMCAIHKARTDHEDRLHAIRMEHEMALLEQVRLRLECTKQLLLAENAKELVRAKHARELIPVRQVREELELKMKRYRLATEETPDKILNIL